MVIASTDKDIHNKEGFVIETELNEESVSPNKHLNEGLLTPTNKHSKQIALNVNRHEPWAGWA